MLSMYLGPRVLSFDIGVNKTAVKQYAFEKYEKMQEKEEMLANCHYFSEKYFQRPTIIYFVLQNHKIA